MEWSGEGVVVSVRKHGESAAIIDVFTPDRGRHAGVVRGGASRKMAAMLQPGSQVQVEWRARLEEHLGSYRVEPLESRADLIGDRVRLAALNAMCSLICFSFPERMVLGSLYDSTTALMDQLNSGGDWQARYALWEFQVLEEMGFGLDLSDCAVTGATQELIYVSPRSGHAVSRKGAGEWVDRMLPLPDFLRNGFDQASDGDVMDALRTTGHFLQTWLAPSLGDRPLPDARARLVERLGRR